MSSEIICNTTGRETRVALIENGRLVELHIDRGDNRGYVGNIYLGKVVRVLPGMQAAFVDIGLERAAFLYVGDIFAGLLNMTDEGVERPSKGRGRGSHPPIQDLLKEGQEIVVQVAKDPIGTKGARLTTHVALPGRYLVFMPTVEHIGISRRIDKDKERRRLRSIVDKHRKKGAGYIVRTVCARQSREVLKADMDFLQGTWDRVQETCKTKKAPSLLHEEYGIVLRAVRDLFEDDVARIIIDHKKTYEQASEFMGGFMAGAKEKLQFYRGNEPIFDH